MSILSNLFNNFNFVTQQNFNCIRHQISKLNNVTMRNLSILSFLVLFINFSMFSQKIVTTVISPAKVIYNESGLKISTKEVNCFDDRRNENMVYQLLIFENLTDAKVNLKAKQELYYDNVCKTCPNDEYNFSYELDAKEKLQGSCDLDSHPSLKIWDHQVNGVYKEVLTDYKLQVVRL